MKFYKRKYQNNCLYLVSIRNIPVQRCGENAIGAIYGSFPSKYTSWNFTKFIARYELKNGIGDIPEEFRNIIQDPLFENEFERWAKKNGF